MNGRLIFLMTVLLIMVVVLFQPAVADTSFELAASLAQKGDLAFSEGKYEEAFAAYNGSISQDPYNSIVWNKLGITQNRLGQYTEAVDSFDHAIRLDPYFGQAWVNKGDALTSLKKIVDANDAYDRAIAINPNDLRALVYKAENLQALGKEEEAQKLFNEVIRISDKEIRVHPNDAKFDAGLYTYRAVALTKLGRYRESLQSFDQALQIDPKHSEAIRNKQALLMSLDTMGNVSLPEPAPVTTAPGMRPTKKGAPLSPCIIVLGFLCGALLLMHRKRSNR